LIIAIISLLPLLMPLIFHYADTPLITLIDAAAIRHFHCHYLPAIHIIDYYAAIDY
jgi:hypothetical protein